MTIDINALDQQITPFLGTLGDLYFRSVADSKRDNISGNPLDAQTETDLAVEKYVMDFLTRISDHPILSEESAKEKDNTQHLLAADAYWVCDPIDGTTFFQQLAYGEFGTLLSLVEDGIIVAGWAYFPGRTKDEDIVVKSLTPDTVLINGVESVVPSKHAKAPDAWVGRFGISKNAYTVTQDERSQFESNKTACGMMKHPRIPGHGHLKFARGEVDYFAHVGSHPWDYTVMNKFVTALGGQVYKFDDVQSACLYEGDAILNAEMVVAVVLPGIDYNAAIGPLFKNTRWEKTCLLSAPM